MRSHYPTVFTDCFCENEKYKDTTAMKRLLQSRQEEVEAINHERALVDALITMSRNLQEHVMGRVYATLSTELLTITDCIHKDRNNRLISL